MNVTLHIPMDSQVRKELEKRAKFLGFDSAQAYIRVWAKAEAEGRTLWFGDDWGTPSPRAVKRLNKAAQEAREGKNVSGPYTSVEAFMKDL